MVNQDYETQAFPSLSGTLGVLAGKRTIDMQAGRRARVYVGVPSADTRDVALVRSLTSVPEGGGL